MSIIEWKNPPYSEEDRADDIAEALKKRPGEWALVLEESDAAEAVADHLAQRHRCEARLVNVQERSAGLPYAPQVWLRADLYARWSRG